MEKKPSEKWESQGTGYLLQIFENESFAQVRPSTAGKWYFNAFGYSNHAADDYNHPDEAKLACEAYILRQANRAIQNLL